MAAKTKRATKSAKKAGDAASSLRENQYVQRLIEDEDLRDSLREAVDSARDAYARIANGKGPAKAIMEDKKVHKDMRKAAESLRDASEQLRGKRKSRLGRLILIAIIGAIIAVVVSEDIRKALLDRLFGAEEEFEYSSTTSQSPETAGTTSS